MILQPPLRSIPKHHRHTAIHFHRDTLHHTCPKLAVELRHRLSLRRKRPLEHRQPIEGRDEGRLDFLLGHMRRLAFLAVIFVVATVDDPPVLIRAVPDLR